MEIINYLTYYLIINFTKKFIKNNKNKMIFEFSKAPMHYVDGIAAFKAGEWPGKLSCKFGPTRKVIRPKTEGIIFNGK